MPSPSTFLLRAHGARDAAGETRLSGVEPIPICLGGALSHMIRCSIIEKCGTLHGVPDNGWNPLHLADSSKNCVWFGHCPRNHSPPAPGEWI
ncbi:hypothetical protein TNCV_4452761 [Trichonephila clavipes]|nr:hypothetical protein TNCV_4452761 [Trichonephila clavipes]